MYEEEIRKTNPSSKQVEPELKECPSNLIAFKWAETLSTGEQSVLLASSLKRLQSAIDSRLSAVSTAPGVDGGNRAHCSSCKHGFCKECNEVGECCKCATEIPPRTVAERLAQHEYIAVVDGVLGGVTPLVSRTRISVHHILSYLYNGNSISYIAENYRLTPDAIKDAIAFAQDVYNDAVDLALRAAATASPAAPVVYKGEIANLLNEVDKTARQLLREGRTATDIDFAVEYIVSRVVALRRATDTAFPAAVAGGKSLSDGEPE